MKGEFDMDTFKSNITGRNEIKEELDMRIKEHLRSVLDEEVYNSWIEDMIFVRADSGCIVAQYYGDKPLALFNRQYKEEIRMYICSVTGYSKKLKISKVKNISKINSEPEIKDETADAAVNINAEMYDSERIYEETGNAKNHESSTKRSRNIKAVKLFLVSAVFAFFAAVIALVACNYISNREFRESFYTVSSLKADSHIRVVQISDLHNCTYGKDNQKLIERVEKLEPDIIICTGDILDSVKNRREDVVNMCEKLAGIAPSYYIYGNNEVEKIYDFHLNQTSLDKKFGFNDDNRDGNKLLEVADSFEKELENCGVKVLKNETDTLSVGSTDIDILGVLTSNPSAFWSYSGEVFESYINSNPNNLKITAIHEPVIFKEFDVEFWGDLILCGHTHGGTVRLPFLGPVYTHEDGLFPERSDGYAYGRYDVKGRPLIVSSGLENSNIFRINNQPELVIVDINKF